MTTQCLTLNGVNQHTMWWLPNVWHWTGLASILCDDHLISDIEWDKQAYHVMTTPWRTLNGVSQHAIMTTSCLTLNGVSPHAVWWLCHFWHLMCWQFSLKWTNIHFCEFLCQSSINNTHNLHTTIHLYIHIIITI